MGLGLLLTAACASSAAPSPGRPAATGNAPPPKAAHAPPGKAPAAPPEPPPPLYRVDTARPEVAFSFDDGPLPGSTDRVLAQLEAHGAHATFFVIGEEALRHPDLVRREMDARDPVESHGQRHLNLAHLSEARLRAVIGQGAATIRRLTGRSPTLLRPPYGSYRALTRRVAAELGQRLVLWSVDTRDWANPGVDAILARVKRQLAPGDIVLFHDGGSPRTETIQALARLWPYLKARGLRVVSVEQLLADAVKPSGSPPPG